LILKLGNILGRTVRIPNFQANLAAFCNEERGHILEKHGKAKTIKYRFHEPKMQPYIIMKAILSGKIREKMLKALLPLK